MTTESSTAMNPLDVQRIMALLPHRYPFLLVDRVVHIESQKYIDAYKCVSVNEPFFQGHFPGLPVMPGVLILEAMAQAGGLLVLSDFKPEELEKSIFLFAGLDGVKFRKPVLPGDRLDLHCELVRQKFTMWKMRGTASVNGVAVADAEMTAVITPKEAI